MMQYVDFMTTARFVVALIPGPLTYGPRAYVNVFSHVCFY